MVTKWSFAGLVSLLALQRVFELNVSRRNERLIRLKGGLEYAPEQLRWMKLLHIGWLISSILEVFGRNRPFIPRLAYPAAILLAAGQILRYAAIRTLGWRWTVNLMTIPGQGLIQRGIYRYIRHPNYLGVIFEMAALPLLHSAYLTAVIFSVANGLLLRKRIGVEEKVLQADNGYQEVFRRQPRFFPQNKLGQ